MAETAISSVAEVQRQDFFVAGEGDIRLFVHEVLASGRQADRVPVLLLHGARVPGVASFDLPVPGGSLAADLALAGHPVYVMDARGYGGSTRPPEMSLPPDAGPPLVRSVEVARDVAAVVEWVRARHGGGPIAALGWATGGQWLGLYATLHPESLSHLVLYNALYGGSATHPGIGLGSDLEDPRAPGRFDSGGTGAYRHNTAASLLTAWTSSIPAEDKAQWRDPAVVAAFQATALASDPTSATRDPASFRAPSGALEDSFYVASGRQLWDASLIRSRPADQQAFATHAAHAPEVRVVTLPNATHHVHLDRPGSGREQFVREVLGFLG